MTEYTLDDYRNAPSGIGPLAAEWRDKPHRLVYDLINRLGWTDTSSQPRCGQPLLFNDQVFAHCTRELHHNPPCSNAVRPVPKCQNCNWKDDPQDPRGIHRCRVHTYDELCVARSTRSWHETQLKKLGE